MKRRITIDLDEKDHTHLKALCANLHVSMRDFVILSLRDTFKVFKEAAKTRKKK